MSSDEVQGYTIETDPLLFWKYDGAERFEIFGPAIIDGGPCIRVKLLGNYAEFSVVWICKSGPRNLIVLHSNFLPSDEQVSCTLHFLESNEVVLMTPEEHAVQQEVLENDLKSTGKVSNFDFKKRVEEFLGPFVDPDAMPNGKIDSSLSPSQSGYTPSKSHVLSTPRPPSESDRFPISLRDFGDENLSATGREDVKRLLSLGHKREWLLCVSRDKVVFDEELSDIDARCS